MEKSISSSSFLVLNYLDIFRDVNIESLKVLGLSDSELQLTINELTKKGFARKINDTITISELGEREIENYRRILLENCDRKDEFLEHCHMFEEINKDFKNLITRWQIKEIDGEFIPNDHSDPEYDMAILESLAEIHEKTIKLLNKMSEIFPFLRGYISRFEKAFSLLMSGSLEYMADPDKQSYHTIWFELHETLLKMSGMRRIE
jgi:pyruvate,orthophosphate dikinase